MVRYILKALLILIFLTTIIYFAYASYTNKQNQDALVNNIDTEIICPLLLGAIRSGDYSHLSIEMSKELKRNVYIFDSSGVYKAYCSDCKDENIITFFTNNNGIYTETSITLGSGEGIFFAEDKPFEDLSYKYIRECMGRYSIDG